MKMLGWANRFNIFCFLDHCGYRFEVPVAESMLAIGGHRHIEAAAGGAFDALREFHGRNPGWLFGHFGYDLKNEEGLLTSSHDDGIGFPDLYFFVPEILVIFRNHSLIIEAEDQLAAEKIFQEICSASPESEKPGSSVKPVSVRQRLTREDYLRTVEQLKKHIARGDCYEVNFCQEFYLPQAEIDPLSVYRKLTEVSPNPFSAFYRIGHRYCLCASPERYLQKRGPGLRSQPIKGTARRHLYDAARDRLEAETLRQSEKERRENVMVVDLVRNDLSRVCESGSVKVDELFGIYSFPQVHQMISTVSGTLKSGMHWTEAVSASFPMGSMTGAPKLRVMQLIEEYERTRRGLFSGAIGYVNPEGDFDFNVVIRSIFYNSRTKYLSFQTGGAITIGSDAEQEYAECLLKASAIVQVLPGAEKLFTQP